MRYTARLEGAGAINASLTKLRRDECGDGCRSEPRGTFLFSPTFFYYFGAPHPYNGDNFGSKGWGRAKAQLKGWGRAKAQLPFCRVHQDGGADGVLCMDRLPTAAEGAVIRKAMGIRKRRPVSLHLLPGAYKPGEDRPVSGKIDLAGVI
jgi:hypothetical protein